ncbi:MAG: L-histidine N(alpha)-methyltransferase [Myxococcota bacterium]
MCPHAGTSRFHLAEEAESPSESFVQDLTRGLGSSPKTLPCHWFYDEIGSQLFEEICELPEYYLTRCERSILEKHATEIAGVFEEPTTLVELGSGSASKTRLIIEAFLERHGRLVFAPIDISRSMLEKSAEVLLDDYPKLEIRAFAGRYESGLEYLAKHQRSPWLTLWLGSSVGNLDRSQAALFLLRTRAGMGAADRLLIGIDLRKDRATLEAAYDDSGGVTARFDLNLLARINRELGGHFDCASFAHRATWRADLGRIESHLISRKTQQVRIDALDLEVGFAAGETIHTENSYKYSLEEIDWLAQEAGMICETQWLDEGGLYSLNLFAPAGA